MKPRIGLIQGIFIFWALLLICRLFYWQIIKGSDLKTQGQLQIGRSEQLPAARGVVLAQDGSPLVANVAKYRLFINPQILPSNIDALIKVLDTLPSSESARRNLDTAKSSDASWFSITSGISASTKELIDSFKIPGAGFDPQPERYYPEGTPSAYLTGFVGKGKDGEDVGYFGLEGYFDRQLMGIPGKRANQADAMGLPILLGVSSYIPPQDGRTLVTSVDRTVQHMAYEKLKEGIDRYQAASGSITVLETKTGRVLAMVSIPGYDQKKYAEVEPNLLRNPIVSDSYEPGSTFKTIIMSSAIDAGAVKADSTCPICGGPVKIAGYTIGSHDSVYYPNSNMFDIILHSDNVGMVYVGRQLGKNRMLDYLRRFGIGKLTGIELQEESTPELRPDAEWQELDVATASFGQGIAVTPLQLVAAVNVIANKGIYVAPRLVTKILDGKKENVLAPPASNRVISLAAAEKVTEMMVNGVKNGAVNIHRIPGFQVAGKTGTAQVPIAGHYDADKTIASFVAFAPAADPKFTMLVTIREPKTTPWGSTTAAPIWFAVAKDLFRYYQIPSVQGL